MSDIKYSVITGEVIKSFDCNTLGYLVIIISKVIDISFNKRRNISLNNYIIDKFAVT